MLKISKSEYQGHNDFIFRTSYWIFPIGCLGYLYPFSTVLDGEPLPNVPFFSYKATLMEFGAYNR